MAPEDAPAARAALDAGAGRLYDARMPKNARTPKRAPKRTEPPIALAIAAALVLGVAAVYAQIAAHEFVILDDPGHYVANPNLDGRFGFDDLRGAFRFYMANWMPLTWVSIAIDNALYGVDATGPLVTNAVLHAIASLLLFAALQRLSLGLPVAAFTAAVFAFHPLHVESVAWASERKDVLMGVGWTAAMLAYAWYRERPGPGRYLAVFAAAAWAMLAKPAAVTLPFALLLLDYWPLRRPRAVLLRAAWIEKLPLFALSAVVSALTFAAQTSAGADTSVQLTLAYRLLNAGVAYAAYLADTFWPSALAVFYPYDPRALLSPTSLAACAVVAVASALAVAFAASRPHWFVGWFWFVGTLVPMIGLVHVGSQARADRYMYIPLIGLAIAVGWETREFALRRPALRRGLAGAGIAAVLALAVAAHAQVRHWHDSVSLFTHAVAVTRNNAVAHATLGAALRERGDLASAEQQLARALELRPESGAARADLGLVRIDQGRIAEARAELERALATGANPAVAHAGLGVAAERTGDIAAAIESYRSALRADPQRRDAANNLAWLLATAPDRSLRAPDEAIELATRVALASPHDPAVLDTLAAAYASAGRYREAVDTQARAVAALGPRVPATAALRADLEGRLARYRSQVD
jgi:tetratricopeptide (TPR) repeat protein